MVCLEFPGDNNRTLMEVQHGVYSEMVARLFAGPRERYLAAAALLGIENDLSKRLRSMNSFDHRTLQLAHDRIAAFFRFSDDGGQLQLSESESDYRRRLEEAWREFVLSEVGRFTTDDEFASAVCTATAFANKERGFAAERWLDEL
jgi:hypothetical protein